MSDRLKAIALFTVIAGIWFLGTQTGLAQPLTDGDTFDVPEPTSMSLLVGGVVAALYMARRHRK
jgi:hypothetical protein